MVNPPSVRNVSATCAGVSSAGVTAGEDEAQAIVGDRHALVLLVTTGRLATPEPVGLDERQRGAVLLVTAGLPARVVDGLAARWSS